MKDRTMGMDEWTKALDQRAERQWRVTGGSVIGLSKGEKHLYTFTFSQFASFKKKSEGTLMWKNSILAYVQEEALAKDTQTIIQENQVYKCK